MLKELINNLTLSQYCKAIEIASDEIYDDDPVSILSIFKEIFNLHDQQVAELYAAPLVEIIEYENQFKEVIMNSTGMYNGKEIKYIKLNNIKYKVPALEQLEYQQFIQLDLLIKDFYNNNKTENQSDEYIEYVNNKFILHNYKLMVEAISILFNIDIETAGKINAREGTQVANFFLIIILNLKYKKIKLSQPRIQ